jgi:ankyrin repeat protein
MNCILFKACEEGNIEVVKELLYHNADIEAKDNYGNNPLILGMLLYYSGF